MAVSVPLDEIIIPEKRYRTIFVEDDLEALANSIAKLGLMQAPVVEKDERTLVAGERRLRAMAQLIEAKKRIIYQGKKLPLGEIPVVPIGLSDSLDIKEAEIDENIKRVQLTWQERAAAISELHELRTKQAEARGEKQTKTATAEEAFENFNQRRITEVREDLILANFLDDPDVVKAKSRKDAMKIVTRKLEVEHRKALAREFDIDKLQTEHHLIRGDLFQELPTFPDTSFDCIISDPPYGVDAHKFANMDAVKHTYVDDVSYSNSVIEIIAVEGYRIAKVRAHFYMFLDINRFAAVKKIVSDAGWEVFNTPFIWSKGPNAGVVPWPHHGPRRSYEAILYAMKGKREVISIGPDLIEIPHDREIERGAHKPADLYAELIRRSCNPGDAVIDPCCGTGPIFEAAQATTTIATGIELDEEGIAFCLRRLAPEEEDI